MLNVKESSKQLNAEKERQISPLLSSQSLLSDMDLLFNQWSNNFFPGIFQQPYRFELPILNELAGTRTPKIDIVDRDDSVIVRAEIPGVNKDDLDVTVTDTSITISGKCKSEEREEKDNYYRCEISRGSYHRVISLPDNVDADKVRANFNDGMLELTLPKKQKSTRRSIKIE